MSDVFKYMTLVCEILVDNEINNNCLVYLQLHMGSIWGKTYTYRKIRDLGGFYVPIYAEFHLSNNF